MRIKKISLKELTIVFLLAVSMLYRINGVKVENIFTYFQYVVNLPLVILGFLKLLYFPKFEKKLITKLLGITTIPYIVAVLYSIALYIFNVTDGTGLVRGISITLQYFYMMFVAVSLIAIFKERAFSVIFKSIVLSYTITLIMAIYSIGFGGLITYLLNPSDSKYVIYFEMHDICLTIGMIIVYLILYKGIRSIHWGYLILSLFIIYCGYKRIAFLACAVTLIIGLLVKRRENKDQKNRIALIMTGIFIMCFVYTYMIQSGILDSLILQFGINSMGRSTFYSYFSQFYQWSLGYLGRGLGFVTKQLQITAARDGGAAYGLYGVRALHNDILAKYIELGMVGSALWFFYYLRTVPNKLKKHFGYNAMRMYCILSIYAFLTYTTDNTMFYFVFQVTLHVIIATVAIEDYKVKREKYMYETKKIH